MNKVSQNQKGSNAGYVIGRDTFAKISAVEGIHLTKEMQKDFSLFEQKNLSPEDRRTAISEKYTR